MSVEKMGYREQSNLCYPRSLFNNILLALCLLNQIARIRVAMRAASTTEGR